TALAPRFRHVPAGEGPPDVAYDLTASPVGELLVAVTDRGLCRIAYRPDDALGELVDDFGARILRVPRRVDQIRHELDEYFEGNRRGFDPPLDLSPGAGISRPGLGAPPRGPCARGTA